MNTKTDQQAQPQAVLSSAELGPLPPADGTAETNKVSHPEGGYEFEEVDAWSEPLVRAYAAEEVARAVSTERLRNAGWFALVMNAAAELEDASNCLRDPDAKRAAQGAANHYRKAAKEQSNAA